MPSKSKKKTSKFKKLSLRNLSRKQALLISFVLVFAVIGGVYIYKSYAAVSGSVVSVRNLSPSGGRYTNYNGKKTVPTWTLWNESGRFTTPYMRGNTQTCLWGRVIGDSHGSVSLKVLPTKIGISSSNLGSKPFSFKQDRRSDRIIKCWTTGNYVEEKHEVRVSVDGAIEFTNLQYNMPR